MNNPSSPSSNHSNPGSGHHHHHQNHHHQHHSNATSVIVSGPASQTYSINGNIVIANVHVLTFGSNDTGILGIDGNRAGGGNKRKSGGKPYYFFIHNQDPQKSMI